MNYNIKPTWKELLSFLEEYMEDHNRIKLKEEELIELYNNKKSDIFKKKKIMENNIIDYNKIYLTSYPIDSIYGFLRHVYITYENFEIHTGMSGVNNKRELVFCSIGYFNTNNRNEGYIILCDDCLEDNLNNMSEKTRRFHFVYNNCDTINTLFLQTTFIWISILMMFIGSIFIYNDFTENFFTTLMFAPMISFLISASVIKYKNIYKENEFFYSCKDIDKKNLEKIIKKDNY